MSAPPCKLECTACTRHIRHELRLLGNRDLKLPFLVFILSLLIVCLMAVLRGGRDERLAAFGLVTAAVVSPLAISHHFVSPEFGILLVDAALLGMLIYIAIRSRAFWPMWAAGFQMCGLAVHLAAAVSPSMFPAVYVEALGVWSVAVLTAVLIGTLLEGEERRGRG